MAKLGYTRNSREKRHFCWLWHLVSQSIFRIWKPRKDHLKALPEISMGHNFCAEQVLSRADSHFLVSSLSFYDFSAAGNGARIWKCVDLGSHIFIFVRTMQVLGDFWRKATMTIHCSNLHHWRLGSYHFLFPIRRGRTAGAQYSIFSHTHTHPFYFYSIYASKKLSVIGWKCRFDLELSWDDKSWGGAHAMIGIGRGNLRHSNSYQNLKGRKSIEGS